jgi:nifR3 family TIM-barrel protein
VRENLHGLKDMPKIGTCDVEHGLVLAPLAGISDTTFRSICKSYGAELVFSEMVSAEGIRRKMRRTLSYLAFSDAERPIALQIFGSNAESLVEAAQILEQEYKPDIIDINLGCPVRKVTKIGAGAALLRDRKKLGEIVSRVVEGVTTPVSAKIRLGWKDNHSVEIAQVLSDCGIRFLTVHARIARSGFGTRANWDAFAPIRKKLSIPIIANGDIDHPENAAYLLKEVGMDAVMIGRGAIGRPWIFSHMREYLTKGLTLSLPGPGKQLASLLTHMDLLEKQWGAQKASGRIKKHIPYYLKSIPGGRKLVHTLLSFKSLDELRSSIEQFAAEFRSGRGDDT